MTTQVDDKAVELIVEGFSWILDVLVYILDNARSWPPRVRPVSRLSMQAFGSPFPCSGGAFFLSYGRGAEIHGDSATTEAPLLQLTSSLHGR